MTEWWTYRPSDFLMFAPRTYWRLFELHNGAWWPAPWLLPPLGLAWLAWVIRQPARALRAGAAGAAVAWAFVGWFFLHERFAPIHWAMNWGAWAFGVQAVLLAALALRPDLQARTTTAARRGGWLLFGFALLVHPLLVLPFGRPWAQAELAGLAPDPTAIATLGLLSCASGPSALTRGLLNAAWALAVAWCLISAATLGTMGSAQGWVPLAAVATAAALRWQTRPRAVSGDAR